jgi:hypothetical protein
VPHHSITIQGYKLPLSSNGSRGLGFLTPGVVFQEACASWARHATLMSPA